MGVFIFLSMFSVAQTKQITLINIVYVTLYKQVQDLRSNVTSVTTTSQINVYIIVLLLIV
jgi:hypothetical protein